MRKFFNIIGQCDPDIHYMVNLDTRLVEIRLLIEQGAFFSINKGRQYGKTTILHLLKQFLQADYIVISLDFQFLSTDSFKNEYTFVSDFSDQLYDELYDASGLNKKTIDEMKDWANSKECNLARLFKFLSVLCATAEKPLILLIDEVDSASNNQVFLDFLAVLRGYYIHRKKRPIYPELKSMLYTILFNGNSVAYNKDNYIIDLADMFDFIRNAEGTVAIANRIFETRLYNYFISEEEVNSKIYRAASNDRNRFVSNGILDMDLVMEMFAVEFNNLYHGEDDRFIEENGRKFFLLFLKPIINGTGNYYVEARTRDNRRTDIIVNYRGVEYVIEVKIWRGGEYNKRGEKQPADYLDLYEAKKGWLLSFHFNKNKVSGMREIQCEDNTLVEVVV